MMALLLGWVGSVYHDVWDAFAVRFVHTPTYGVLLEQCYPTRLCLLKWYPTDNFINKGNNRTTIAGTHIGLPYPCVRGQVSTFKPGTYNKRDTRFTIAITKEIIVVPPPHPGCYRLQVFEQVYSFKSGSYVKGGQQGPWFGKGSQLENVYKTNGDVA